MHVKTLEYLTRNVEPRQVVGDWGVHYRYTYGVAGERFFRELREQGRLLASSCPRCRRRFLPPSLYCEDCFVEMTEYTPVEGVGTVESFTVLHRSLEDEPLTNPIVAAFVRFEGVTGGLLAPVEGVAPQQVQIGMKVRPVIRPGLPSGSIRDLTFAPA